MEQSLVTNYQDLSVEDLELLEQRIHEFEPDEQQEILKLLDTFTEQKGYDEARQKFIPFVQSVWPDFIAGRHHHIMADAFERVAKGELKRLIISMPPRHPLRTDTPVLTSKGFKTIAEIEEGDYVYTEKGELTKVIGKSPMYKNRKLYRCETNDGGEPVWADGVHLWRAKPKDARVFKTYTTEQLYKLQERKGRMAVLPEYAAPKTSSSELPVGPYTLGAWLGDGCSHHVTITKPGEQGDIVRSNIEREGYATSDRATEGTFGVLGVQTILKSLGLMPEKFIPDVYMTADSGSKKELLKGLMDTDGNVTKGGQSFFNTSNEKLKNQIVELLCSLGIRAKPCECEAKIGDKSYGKYWRVACYAEGLATVPSKRDRMRRYRKTVNRLIKFTPDGVGDTQCIQVKDPDGLFLVGRGYIVSSNTKSEFGSWLLPSWFLGRYPKKKVMQLSNTQELASNFGEKVRDTLDMEKDETGSEVEEVYHKIFPETRLKAGNKSRHRWKTDQNGEYFAIGVNGRVTGRGADLLIIDDPHDEQEAKQAESNPEVFDSVFEWYTSGPRQRLQPGGAIIIIMTRWSKRDLAGRVLAKEKDRSDKDHGDRWEVIHLPAIIDEYTEHERSLWPEYWDLDTLRSTRAEIDVAKWNAQYQQEPTSRTGAIIKDIWWKDWLYDTPPSCSYIIQSWDTAFTKERRSDYSACTTWGIFTHEDEETGQPIDNIILLDAMKARMEFPQLKQQVQTNYQRFRPDTLIVEAKGSGISLIQELRAMGVPVEGAHFGRGTARQANDKIARANAVTSIFSSGRVWAPKNRRFADMVITECMDFPNGEHDDFVDSAVQAMLRFREGGFISTVEDEDEDEYATPPRRHISYY